MASDRLTLVLSLVVVASCLAAVTLQEGASALPGMTFGIGAIVLGSLSAGLVRRRRRRPAPQLPDWLTRAQRAEVYGALGRGEAPDDPALAQALVDYVDAERGGRPSVQPTPKRRSRLVLFLLVNWAAAVCALFVGFSAVAAINDLGDGQLRKGVGDVVGALALLGAFILIPLVGLGRGRRRVRAAESARAVLSAQ